MKVLVTGSKGQVGHCLVQLLSNRQDVDLIAYDRDEMDITNELCVKEKILALKPDVIINAAAHTAVDKAETDIEMSYAINRDGPAYLSQSAKDVGALMLHISTDYVFAGTKDSPYIETDVVGPQSIYGQSKLAGEQVIVENCSRYAILRTAWVFGEHGNNFVKNMLRLGKERNELGIIGDQFGGPTYAGDIATALIKMMEQFQQYYETPSGIYHYSGAPHVNWYQFACEIFEMANKQQVLTEVPAVKQITTNEYSTPAPRPANSILNCQKIKEVFGIEPSNWKLALENIREYQ